MRDRVILMVGLYDTLDIFTYELKKEFEKIGVDAVEQCLPWWDMDGSKILRQKVNMQIMLDESIHSPVDAAKACKMDAADILNIKLMKCGGLTNALKIASAAEIYGVECMLWIRRWVCRVASPLRAVYIHCLRNRVLAWIWISNSDNKCSAGMR